MAPGRDEGRTGDGGTGMKGPEMASEGRFCWKWWKNQKKIVQQKSVSCAPNQKDSTLSLPEYLVIIPPRVVSLASAGVEYVDKVNPVNRLGFASSI